MSIVTTFSQQRQLLLAAESMSMGLKSNRNNHRITTSRLRTYVFFLRVTVSKVYSRRQKSHQDQIGHADDRKHEHNSNAWPTRPAPQAPRITLRGGAGRQTPKSSTASSTTTTRLLPVPSIPASCTGPRIAGSVMIEGV